MATKKPLALYTSPSNRAQEILVTDTIDPVSLGITGSPVGTSDTQTLTNKTLTDPKINAIKDTSGNTSITVVATASAVNNLLARNTAAGAGVVSLEAEGADTNITLNLVPKGTGSVQVAGSDLITASSTTTLTNKTLTEPRITDSVTHQIQGATPPYPSGGAILDGSGQRIIGTYGTGNGTYLTIRNNAAISSSIISVINLYATSSDDNSGIRFRPKGTGTVTINRSDLGFATNAFVKMLDNADSVSIPDFRSITVPPSSGLALGYMPGGTVSSVSGVPTVNCAAGRPIDLNRIYFYPFVAPRNGASSVTVSGFTLCTDANHNTATNVRVGIWTNAGASANYPNALVSGSEVIQATGNVASTVLTNTSMTASLTPGALYWMGFCFDAATALMKLYPPTATRFTPLGCAPSTAASSGFYNATTLGINTGLVVNFIYGAFLADTSTLTASMGYLTNTNVDNGVVTTTPNLAHQIIYGS